MVLPALPEAGDAVSQDCEDAAVHAPVQVTTRVSWRVPPSPEENQSAESGSMTIAGVAAAWMRVNIADFSPSVVSKYTRQRRISSSGFAV